MFSEEDIKEAVWNCGVEKSPGLDGFGGQFFKSCWELVKEDVYRVFTDFHRNSKLCKCMNNTFISLIPKVGNPVDICEYRPISLVSSVYKIIAKVLANRLGKKLEKVISKKQSAFIVNRNILDGVLIANEVIDEAKKRKSKIFMFKIDFEMAYDSVSWEFLYDMMRMLGFG